MLNLITTRNRFGLLLSPKNTKRDNSHTCAVSMIFAKIIRPNRIGIIWYFAVNPVHNFSCITSHFLRSKKFTYYSKSS